MTQQVDSNDLVIKVQGLGMCFHTHTQSAGSGFARLADQSRRWFGKNTKRPAKAVGGREKWVFRSLSFDVRRGEVLGIIGTNGCGKTTLLKILSRVLTPTEGRVEIRGRVSSLLAVGTGFNLAFTGRENVYLNGMILGLSRAEITEKFDSIVEFADIGDALDEPVRHYSSGMRARLAFAVAAQLDSDILMLDEVLSVGDAGFREKSLDVIRGMKQSGKTILLVSHNMDSINTFCDRAMEIRSGQISRLGDPNEVIRGYLNEFISNGRNAIALRDRPDRDGNGSLIATDYHIETPSGIEVRVPQAGNSIVIALDYESAMRAPLQNVSIGLAVKALGSGWLSRFSTESLACNFNVVPAKGRFKLSIPHFPFAEGRYMCGYRILVNGEVADYIPNAFEFDAMRGDFFGTGHADNHSPVYVPHDWQVESSDAATEDTATMDVRKAGR